VSRRLIRYAGRMSGNHPWIALPMVALLTLAAGYLAWSRLVVEMDVAALLPKDSPEYRDRSQADFLFGLGNNDFLLCALEIPDSAPVGVKAKPGEYLRAIKPAVEFALDDNRYFSRRGDVMRQGEELEFRRAGAAKVALLTPSDFNEVETRLKSEAIRARVSAIAARIAEDPSTTTLASLSHDPFGIEELLSSRAVAMGGPLKRYWREGYYLSDDERVLLLVLWPASASTNLVKARELADFLGETREALYKRNPEWRDTVLIDFVGPHMENAEGTAEVHRDVYTTSIISFVAVLLLFVVAFRQPEALLFVAAPLVIGVVWTLGLTSLVVPHITQVTLTFAAILIGLGIDFSIHLYNRYLEEVRAGRDVREALASATYSVGPSLMAGAITTGFAFFAMTLTEFQGFRELGLFGGIGIIMCLTAVILTVPPLMMLMAPLSRRTSGPLATLGLKTVTFTVQAYPRITVCAGMSLAAFFGLQANKAEFSDDFRSLRQPSDDYVELLARIDSHFSVPTNQIMVIVEGAELEDALEANDQVYRNIQSSRSLFGIVDVDSLRLLYPSAKTQASELRRFAEIPVASIEQELTLAAREHSAVPAGFFQPFATWLRDLVEDCNRDLAAGTVPVELGAGENRAFQDVVRNFLAHDATNGVYRVITRIYPPAEPRWQDVIPQVFLEGLSTDLEPPPKVVGNAVLSAKLQDLMVRSLVFVALAVFASIIVYLYFYFQSAARSLLAMVPVVFALLGMLASVHIMGIKLTYLNVIALPMIVGIGVDSAIHLLGRFYEDEGRNMRFAIERTGRAIVVTGLTTIMGFGSLTFASFQGIREIGILAIVGTLCTMFATLVFLPAILKLLDPRFTYRGGGGDEIG